MQPLALGRRVLTAAALVLALGGAAGCGAVPVPGSGGAGSRYAHAYRPDGSATIVAGQALTLRLGDMYFRPNTLIVARGTAVQLELHNGSRIEHNFTVEPLGISQNVGPGQTATVHFTPTTAGTYYFYCAVPGHAAAGMVGRLTVRQATR